MHNYKAILFDLDGTIIDSAEGIFNCLEFSLQHFGIKQPREAFYKCLGPSLRLSFADFLPPDKIEEAIKIYRERYSEKGLYECRLYDNAAEMLKALKLKGFCVALATSKPEVYARQILKSYGIDELFDFIGGALLTEERDTKAKVIKYVMNTLKLKKEETLMVGDRMHDMQGAEECSISAAAVLYGYGTREELCDNYKPVFVAETVQELCSWLTQE